MSFINRLLEQEFSAGFDKAAMKAALNSLGLTRIGPEMKGIPTAAYGLSLEEVASKSWSLLAGDLPAPVAVIKQSTLDHNAHWMQHLLGHFGLVLAPHAKTTMTPHIFAHQAAHGSWGLTVATAQQALVAAEYGCRRIIVANQITGTEQIRAIADIKRRFPTLQIHVFVDSVAGATALAETLKQLAAKLSVLLDVGFDHGRTGCRTLDQASEVFDVLANQQDTTPLSGIGGYEGLISQSNGQEDAKAVEAYFDVFAAVVAEADRRGLFTAKEIILTAGGSSYYDVVGKRLAEVKLSRPSVKVLRSGCYATHDCGTYVNHSKELAERSPELTEALGDLDAALFVWGLVQSAPEPGLALVTAGKRDVGYDAHLPVPVAHFRPGEMRSPVKASGTWSITKLNDQHAYLSGIKTGELAVGDLICLGISHPCTTFDKWRMIHLVDDNWVSKGVMPTFF